MRNRPASVKLRFKKKLPGLEDANFHDMLRSPEKPE